jgi:cytochrome c biogenesis protein CcmG, thiol:disulfide interchange protein DsbE
VRLLAGVMVLGLMASLTGAALAAPTVGQPAPPFSLTLLDGRAISLSEFKGKPIVVNFWHSG